MDIDATPRPISDLRSLQSLLAGLLPGNGSWPCAADLDLEPAIASLAASSDAYAEALHLLAEVELPPRTDPDALEQALTELQARQPAAFGSLMLLAYGAYYAHPAVLAVVEERSGYPARPPMPSGHPVLLAGPDRTPATAGGAPSWRLDGTPTAERVRELQAADPQRVWTQEEIWSWLTS